MRSTLPAALNPDPATKTRPPSTETGAALAFRRPTKAFEDAVSQGGANLRLLKLTGANPIEGGVPIIVDGKLIGAVGVSGASASQDGQVARAGIDALK
jgi:glc operon protein GlcG